MKKRKKSQSHKVTKSQRKDKNSKRHCEEILCAGFGGQGIMLMGKLLAEAGLIAGKYVTWMPSYGAEVRGGTAYSMTKISDKEIASPIVTNPDILIVMNKPSLIKYQDKIRDGSILISNKSLIDEVARPKNAALVNIQMTEIALKLGDVRCANMIAVGALTKRSKMLSLGNVLTALKNIMKDKEELFALNKSALERGHKS